MVYEFDVSYDDNTRTFMFWPLPDDNTAVGALKNNLDRMFTHDALLGRGSKRWEWHPTRIVYHWSEDLDRMISSQYGATIKAIFDCREEAAKFKLLYCADGKFTSKTRMY